MEATAQTCDQFNAEAIAIRDSEGISDYDALMRVVENHGMTLDKDDDQIRTYRLADGTTVLCWIEGTEAGIRDNGIGFAPHTWEPD